MRTLLSIFISFFKIGLFTFGGGYSMILMMQREVADKQKWVEKQEFLDYLALAQASPGPMAINLAILIGYHRLGFKGGMAGFLGSALPSFIVLLLVAVFFREIYSIEVVEKIFMGIRPAVVALILLPVINFAKDVTKWEYPLCAAVAVAIFFGFPPVYIIFGAILVAVIYTLRFGRSHIK